MKERFTLAKCIAKTLTVLGLWAAGLVNADTVIYGSSRDGNALLEINLTEVSSEVVHTMNAASRSIDIDPVTKRVYYFEWGVDSDELAYWDQTTGEETLIRRYGQSPQKLITSMAMAANGNLYLLDDQSEVFQLDKGLGLGMYFGDLDGNEAVMGDIAFSPSGTLYVVSENDLSVINPSNLFVSAVHSDVIADDPNIALSGVSYCNGSIYVTDTNLNTGESSLYEIDPFSGNTTLLLGLGRLVDDLTACVDLDAEPNNAPEAYDDQYTIDEDQPLVISAPGVLDNDQDIDGDQITAQLVDAPAKGNLTLNDDGSFSYQPNENVNGSDSFTYRADDGPDQSTVATVTITIDPINDAPVADAQVVSLFENTQVDITLTGSDPENAPLSFSITDTPESGSLNGEAPNLSYVPNTNFLGQDSFSFRVNDGQLDSDVVTVTIDVTEFNNAPVALADSYVIAEDNTLIAPVDAGVLDNDSDLDGQLLTAVLATTVSHGQLTLNGDGSFSYQPNQNYVGDDVFTYRASDGQLDSVETSVSITVSAVNDAPVAVADSYEVIVNGSLDVFAPGVLENDTDAENDALVVELVSDASGNLSLNPDGSFTYSPVADFIGEDSFSYRLFDGAEYSDAVVVTITVDDGEDVIIYGSNRLGEMVEINLTDNSYQLVAPLALGTQAMEQDFSTPDNLVYYYELGFDADQFMTWNPVTGENVEVVEYGTSPGKYGKRMAIAPDGTMYVMDSEDALYIFDKTNGDADFQGFVEGMIIGDLGGTGDFAFAPDGTLYVMTYQHLYTIDLVTLQATEIASDMFAGEEIEGIELVWTGVAYCDGMLYASHAEVETEVSALYVINPSTGDSTRLYEFSTYLNDLTSCSAISQ